MVEKKSYAFKKERCIISENCKSFQWVLTLEINVIQSFNLIFNKICGKLFSIGHTKEQKTEFFVPDPNYSSKMIIQPQQYSPWD